jgi:hypothetical protein
LKKLIWVALFFVLLFLVACGSEENADQAESEEELATLDVDFSVPETVDAEETIELKATVTYGEENVTDADEVVFEIWEKGKEDDSWEVKSTNNEDGTYTAETSFDQIGIYEMYAHTTAKELHTMPKKEVTVGSGETSTEEESDHEATDQEEGHEHDHSHDAAADGFSMHFAMPTGLEVAQDVKLVTHLQMDEEAMEEASVRYELWLDGAEKHSWVDAEESNPGEYIATHQFDGKGTYHVVVHVENEDGLHEHEEHEIEVK